MGANGEGWARTATGQQNVSGPAHGKGNMISLGGLGTEAAGTAYWKSVVSAATSYGVVL